MVGYDRREALRLGGATVGIGLAGCSSVPFVGGSGSGSSLPDFTSWVWDPAVVGPNDHHIVEYWDEAAIRESPRESRTASRVPEMFEWTDLNHSLHIRPAPSDGLGRTVVVYRGTLDAEAVRSDLEDDDDTEATDSIEGVPTYRTWAGEYWAITDDFFVAVPAATEPELRRDIFHAAVSAQIGQLRTYTQGNDDFAAAVERLDGWMDVTASTRSVGQDDWATDFPVDVDGGTSPLVEVVGEFTAHGRGAEYLDEGSRETEVFVFPSADEIDRSGLEQYAAHLEERGFRDPLVDLSSRVEGRVGLVEIELADSEASN